MATPTDAVVQAGAREERLSAHPDRGVVESRSGPSRQRRPYWLAVAVLLAGLAVTATLFAVSQSQYRSTEKRLLSLRLRELALVLTEAIPTSETPLESGAELADASGGNTATFRRFADPIVGPGKTFLSLSLWRLSDIAAGPIAAVGRYPLIAREPARAQAFFAMTAARDQPTVIAFGAPLITRLGEAYSSHRFGGGFAVYSENPLPASRHSKLQSNQAFSELYYAFYFGPRPRAQDLLVSDAPRLPIAGERAQAQVPYGQSALTVVVSPRIPLAGTLPERLPWIILIAGVLLSLGATALTARLAQRQRAALALAGQLEHTLQENRELYAEQRTIAETLQHALLPDRLPQLDSLEAVARYTPGERGLEIGGDWYDVIALDDRWVVLVVGDVSGRGLAAATTMASLRYGIHAYAAQDGSPPMILGGLSRLLNVSTSGQLATVLCGLIDLRNGELTVASAGHLPPLLLQGGSARYLEVAPGVPIGVEAGATYATATVALEPGDTFLAFTDGLVERREEAIDSGLERLRQAAQDGPSDLDALVDGLLRALRREPAEDDTAVIAVRWLGAQAGRQTVTLPPEAKSVAAARRFVVEALDGHQAEVLDAVQLMVSELATNAVRHAGTEFELELAVRGGQIRIEVSDTGDGVPEARDAGPDDMSGRGLQIVEMLAGGWGVERRSPAGKTVWFTIAA